jgi:hypothetical protein
MPAIWGCAEASPLVEIDGGYRNPHHGYWIGQPPAANPPWERREIEGSLLAYHRVALAQRDAGERGAPGAVYMTFSSRCGEPLAAPEYLARHLRIGIPPNVVRESGPIEIDGLAGWEQVFDADAPRGAVRVKTVTIAANGCALDWVLVARDTVEFEQAEPDFDAWWHTVSVEPRRGPESAAAAAEPAP